MVKISKSLAKSSEKDMTRIFNPMLIAMFFKKYFGFEFPGKPPPPLSQLIICLSTIRHTISLPLKRHQIEDVKVLWKKRNKRAHVPEVGVQLLISNRIELFSESFMRWCICYATKKRWGNLRKNFAQSLCMRYFVT